MARRSLDPIAYRVELVYDCVPETKQSKTMKLAQFTTMAGYLQASQFNNQRLVDHFLDGDQGDQIRSEMKLKRIQFDTSPDLAEKLESVCSLLDCSKRVFLEMAVREAIEAAEAQFDDAFKDAFGMGFVEALEARDAAIDAAQSEQAGV